MLTRKQLNSTVSIRATFPDSRILRLNLIWALFANLAIAGFLNLLGITLGLPDSAVLSLGTLYIVLLSLWFLPLDPLTALLGGAVLFSATSLLQTVFAPMSSSPTYIWGAILIVAYVLLTIVPYVWRDRIVTGQFESDQGELNKAMIKTLPIAFWQFLLLVLLDFEWRPALKKKLAALEREQYFCQENGHWRNWAHIASANPSRVYLPETLEDLQQIVREANAYQKGIRVVGRSYSWANWATTDDILVHCRRLCKVEIDLSDPKQPHVIAEAGATNRQINDVIEKHGYTLPSNVVLEVVRIGGVVSTGSHGSGWHNPTMSDYVHAMDIVSADGRCRHYEVGKDSDEIMDAVRLNLGLFGLIWRVTLDVQPSWHVRMRDYRCTKEEMFSQIRAWVTTYDAVDIFYFPYCKKVWIKFQERINHAEQVVSLRHSTLDLLWSSLQMELVRFGCFLMHRFPRATLHFHRLAFPLVQRHDVIVPVADWVHHRRSVDSVRMGNIEIVFKLDEAFESFFKAWHSFESITEAYAEQGKYPFNVAVNVRFIHKSSALLSPAHGDGHTCCFEILGTLKTPHWDVYAGELAEAWLQLPMAAPHWPKQWETIPNVDHYLRERYAGNIRRFLQIREELGVDPNDMFVNKLTRRLMNLAVPEGDLPAGPGQTNVRSPNRLKSKGVSLEPTRGFEPRTC